MNEIRNNLKDDGNAGNLNLILIEKELDEKFGN